VIASATSRAAFVHGGNKGIATTSFNSTTTGQARIGSSGTTQGGYYGWMAEVALWDIALSDEEVYNLSQGLSADRVRLNNLRYYAPFHMKVPTIDGVAKITNKFFSVRNLAPAANRAILTPDHPPVRYKGEFQGYGKMLTARKRTAQSILIE
jgi:hypothetical protein